MRKLILFIAALTLFAILFTASEKNDLFTTKIVKTIKTLEFENIESIITELERDAGTRFPINYTFDFDNNTHMLIIKDIIKLLNSAKIQGYSDEKITNKGSSPTFLIIKLKDGSLIQIKSAIGGKVTKFPDGSSLISHIDIPNEITISLTPYEKPIRVFSPEIKKLIIDGYKDIFK